MVDVQWLGRSAPQFILVSDLDHTMVQNEDSQHVKLLAFNRVWLKDLSAQSCLVFSTGRSPALYKQLWDEAPLVTPDILICSVGTEIYYRAPSTGDFVPDMEWQKHLAKGWDRGAVLQAASEQRRFKVSFRLKGVSSHEAGDQLVAALRTELQQKGVACKVIFSGGADVDVLAIGAGKGEALAFLLQRLAAAGVHPSAGVQVNGDSGNDAELLTVPGVRGCVVGNAHPELLAFYDANRTDNIYKAEQHCSAGIVEALHHFGTISAVQSLVEDAAMVGARAAVSLLPQLHHAVHVSAAGGCEVVKGDANGSTPDSAPYGGSPVRGDVAVSGDGVGANGCQDEANHQIADIAPSDACTFIGADGTLKILPARAVAAAAAAPPPAGMWVDHVTVRALSPCGMWLATYQLWRLAADGTRDPAAVLQCTAVLKCVEGGPSTPVHVQETRVQAGLVLTPSIKEVPAEASAL